MQVGHAAHKSSSGINKYMKTYYILYQVTNNLNGKIYVGVHKTQNLDDGYMGSGKIIRSAIQKHGISNFSKVILEQFENADAMYAREKEVVTDEFLAREDTYNLRRGGTGGFDYINSIKTSKESSYFGRLGAAATNLIKQNSGKPWFSEEAKANSLKSRKAMNAGLFDPAIAANGRRLANSDAARAKRSATMRNNGTHRGSSNPNYGKIWVTDGHRNIMCLPDKIPTGWSKGRTKFPLRIDSDSDAS